MNNNNLLNLSGKKSKKTHRAVMLMYFNRFKIAKAHNPMSRPSKSQNRMIALGHLFQLLKKARIVLTLANKTSALTTRPRSIWILSKKTETHQNRLWQKTQSYRMSNLRRLRSRRKKNRERFTKTPNSTTKKYCSKLRKWWTN